MQGQEALQENLFNHVPVGDDPGKATSVLTSTPGVSLVSSSDEHYVPTALELWMAGFVVLNLVIAEILFYTPTYRRFEGELREILLYFSLILAIGVCTLSTSRLFDYASKQLVAGRWVAELNAALGVFLLAIYFAYGFIFERQVLVQQKLTQTLLIAASLFLFLQKGFSLIRLHLFTEGRDLLPQDDNSRKLGDQISLGNGDLVPCDGVIISGDAEVQERRFSPLPVLRIKRKNDLLYAGSRIISGKITLEIQGLAVDSPMSWFLQRFRKGLTGLETRQQRRMRFVYAWNLVCFALALLGAQLLLSQGAPFSEVVRFASSLLLISLFSHLFTWDLVVLRVLSDKFFRLGFLLKDYSSLLCLHTLKNLVIDYSFDRPTVSESVVRFQPLDDFVDREGLLRTVILVLSNSDDPVYLNIAQLCRAELKEALGVLPVDKYREYDGLGVCAEVSGAQVSIGTEEFMLARGVDLQASDLELSNSDSRAILVALGTNIAARFELGQSKAELEAVGLLRKSGIRLHLLSREAAEIADSAGKKLGLELSNIHGGISEADYAQRLSQVENCAVLTNGITDPTVLRPVAFSIAPFDDLLWDTESYDLTVFDPKLSGIASFFVAPQRLPRLLRTGTGLVVGTPIALIPLLYFGFFGPGDVLIAAGLLVAVLSLLARRITV